MPTTSPQPITLKRRKLNESTALPIRKPIHRVSLQASVKHKNSLSNPTILPSSSTPTTKVESEKTLLAELPRAKNLQTNRLTTTNYSGLKSASKRKRVVDNSNSLFLPSCASENQIQEHNSPKTDTPQSNPVSRVITTRTTQHPVGFYNTVMKKEPYTRSELIFFQYIGTLIQNRDKIRTTKELEELYSSLRGHVHQAECADFVSKALIQKSKLLDERGLPAVMNSALNVYPHDIRADCEMLYNRWIIGDVDPHLLRGLQITKKKVKDIKSLTTQSFEANYQWRVSCNYVGHGNLVNGQWWPLQMCAMRDGAHGEIQGGIHGKVGEGAFSVIISGGTYQDIDNGEEVEYCGTAGAKGVASLATKLMTESYSVGNPVRLLRSSKSLKSGVYRPSKGIRYDGLYSITAVTTLDIEKAMYRFSLRRCLGQDPIRYQGVEARPTFEQLKQLEEIYEIRAVQA